MEPEADGPGTWSRYWPRPWPKVPGFELDTYDPTKEDFGKFSLDEQIKHKRWTILFFYPADFTFV